VKAVAKLIDKHRVARMTGGLLAGFIKTVAGTSRLVCEPPNHRAHLDPLVPGIVALWHGQFLMCPIARPKDYKLNIIVAQHGDAEFIAQALQRFGVELIRGAGAGKRLKDRGGARAFVAAVKALQAGENVALTADIPPGPARVAGSGIVKLAQITGRPIIPLATATTHYYAFKTWSRMTLNLPFSTLAAVYGDPIWVAKDASEAELEEARLAVERGLNATTAKAYELAGADPARATPPPASMAPAAPVEEPVTGS
jgi:lysophospholipid acyltransferase (LPLAT)-like uncharacterized protein